MATKTVAVADGQMAIEEERRKEQELLRCRLQALEQWEKNLQDEQLAAQRIAEAARASMLSAQERAAAEYAKGFRAQQEALQMTAEARERLQLLSLPLVRRLEDEETVGRRSIADQRTNFFLRIMEDVDRDAHAIAERLKWRADLARRGGLSEMRSARLSDARSLPPRKLHTWRSCPGGDREIERS